MDEQTRNKVRDRADNVCEYCRLPQSAMWGSFHVDHVVAVQHVSDERLENLCLACPQCNLHKGTNLTSVDPLTGEIVRLFDPRLDRWNEHFTIQNHVVIGLTAMGRTTARLLAMNNFQRVELRKILNIGS